MIVGYSLLPGQGVVTVLVGCGGGGGCNDDDGGGGLEILFPS